MVTSNGDNRVKLHSRVSKYVEKTLPESFLDILRPFISKNIWACIYLDNDREWILETILSNTLDVAHDSPYQPEISKIVCSAIV